MMTDPKRLLWLMVAVAALGGCDREAGSADAVDGRWYTAAQVAQGRELFHRHCASCHGPQAEGTAQWRTPDSAGNYPPPPLNGSAHAWHHSLEALERTIAVGGAPFGGVMPGFAGTLSEAERLATIAYFQSHWPSEIYDRWRR